MGRARSTARFQAGSRSYATGGRPVWALALAASVAVHIILLGFFSFNRIPFPVSAPDPVPLVVLEPHEDAYVAPAVPDVSLPELSPPILRPGLPIEIQAEPAVEPGEPAHIPHDVAPVLVNAGEVTEALASSAPEVLESGLGSVVVFWLFVDRSGDVTRLRLRSSSGSDRLDEMAQRGARAMKFRPALHGGESVAVWVAQQIRFTRPSGD